MHFFALDTSSETLSLAVSREGTVFRRDIPDAGQRNSELALPTLHALLAEAGLSLRDLTAIAVGVGPGSFTGVRIACGIAQGLSYGLGVRAIALPSTLAVAAAAAAQYPDAERLLVAIDARMHETYWAAYRRNEAAPTGFDECAAPALSSPAALRLPMAEEAAPWIGAGTAFADPALAAGLHAALDGALRNTAVVTPSAAALAAIAARLWRRQGPSCTIAPHEILPLYLRNKVALTLEERRQPQGVESAA